MKKNTYRDVTPGVQHHRFRSIAPSQLPGGPCGFRDVTPRPAADDGCRKLVGGRPDGVRFSVPAPSQLPLNATPRESFSIAAMTRMRTLIHRTLGFVEFECAPGHPTWQAVAFTDEVRECVQRAIDQANMVYAGMQTHFSSAVEWSEYSMALDALWLDELEIALNTVPAGVHVPPPCIGFNNYSWFWDAIWATTGTVPVTIDFGVLGTVSEEMLLFGQNPFPAAATVRICLRTRPYWGEGPYRAELEMGPRPQLRT